MMSALTVWRGQVGMCRLLCECPKAWSFACWGDAMGAACKTLQTRGGIQMSGVGAEDDLDFDFLVSYNNSSYMALVNAAQDKSVSDPRPLAHSPRVASRARLIALAACRMWHAFGACRQALTKILYFYLRRSWIRCQMWRTRGDSWWSGCSRRHLRLRSLLLSSTSWR